MQQDIDRRPKVSLRGFLSLFGVLVLVGVVMGGVVSLVKNFLYLILLFPLLMGGVAGYFIKAVVVTEKIRSGLLVVIAGIFAAVLIYGSMFFFDYLQFRRNMAKFIQSQALADYGESPSKEKTQVFIDYILLQETGSSGFIGFILLRAKDGVSISEVGRGNSSATNLGIFTWLFWLVEMAFIGGPAIATSFGKTKDLFCEHCDAWIAEGEHIGGIEPKAMQDVVALIKHSDMAGFIRMLRSDTLLPSVEFYIRACKTCNIFPLHLVGSVISSGRQGQTQSKLILMHALTSSERFALTSELNTKNK